MAKTPPTPAQAGNPAGHRRPRHQRPARLRQSRRLSRLDRALSDRRGPGRPPRPLSIRPPRHADLRGAGGRAAHARGRELRRRRAAAVGTGGDLHRLARGRRFRRSHPGHRQRLPADAQFLRRPVQAHGRDHHLLRSADRRRHRQPVQAEHQGGVRRGARLAELRDAGHSGHRQGRARQGRGRADGQYLGDAALFPRARQRRRSVDPGRHQIYRRPFRHHVRLRLGQRRDACRRSRPRCSRSASASDRTTCSWRCAACARSRCGWRATTNRA